MQNTKGSATIVITPTDTGCFTLESHGTWTNRHVKWVAGSIQKIMTEIDSCNIMWDFSHVSAFDSAGIMLVVDTIYKLRQKNCMVTCQNMKPEHQRQLVFYRKNYIADALKKQIPPKPRTGFFEKMGKTAFNASEGFMEFLHFTGESAVSAYKILKKPRLFRLRATVRHIDHSGIRALPIIALTAFLVGLVIAYQGADQLARFGANIFIVEMVSISVMRELSPLITAIVIAGRSASSYTAEIGTMKITEEVDAMKTMGFEPHIFLVMPRILALVISMPLIVFFADLVGIYGGMLIAKYQLDISMVEFITRMHAEVDVRHFFIGLIKAPFYGIIIAQIGCFRGFQVIGSTESIGQYTTVSVVNAIFWVIAINAGFSVILTEIGI